MISANQKYKQSGTSKSFKEWLIEEQSQGGLQVHNKSNLAENPVVDKKFALSKTNRNILILLGVIAIGYGYHRFKNKG
tara:strand:- start:2346 stop:2579 length:234 start_codon:yes stop_codon:yes gene_type:complete